MMSKFTFPLVAGLAITFSGSLEGQNTIMSQEESLARSNLLLFWKAKLTADSLSLDMVADQNSFGGLRIFDDKDLPEVAKLQSLKSLHLHRTYISGVGFSHLKALKKLEELSLEGSFIEDRGLKDLKELANLKKLNLKATRITPDGLNHLKECKVLEELAITPSKAAIEVLAKIGKLNCIVQKMPDGKRYLRFDAYDRGIDDDAMAVLCDIPDLYLLSLRGTKTTEKSAKLLGKMKSLVLLELSGRFSDVGLKELAGLQDLEWLGGIKTSGGNGKDLLIFPKLKYLEISKVDEDVVSNATKIKGLTGLKLTEARMNRESLSKLYGLKNLKSLYISHYTFMPYSSKADSQAKTALQKALPKCEVLLQDLRK